MSGSLDSNDRAVAEDETPRDTANTDETEDRDDEGEEVHKIPPEARDEEEYYQDKYDEAREVENPDQHRDEYEYD